MNGIWMYRNIETYSEETLLVGRLLGRGTSPPGHTATRYDVIS